jgi:predicted MFS family arabinose efflux permease
LRNPWWVLPFEFIQGITHAAVWAALCSYISHATPPELRPSANGVIQGIHNGVGKACGAIFGGLFVRYWGTQATFRAYGFFCLLVLVVFVFIHFFHDGKFNFNLTDIQDPRVVNQIILLLYLLEV